MKSNKYSSNTNSKGKTKYIFKSFHCCCSKIVPGTELLSKILCAKITTEIFGLIFGSLFLLIRQLIESSSIILIIWVIFNITVIITNFISLILGCCASSNIKTKGIPDVWLLELSLKFTVYSCIFDAVNTFLISLIFLLYAFVFSQLADGASNLVYLVVSPFFIGAWALMIYSTGIIQMCYLGFEALDQIENGSKLTEIKSYEV